MTDWESTKTSKKDDLSSARSEASQFLSDLRKKDNNSQNKIRTAKELYRYITVSLKNEEQRYVEEFVNLLDTRDDQSAIFEGIYSDDPDQRTTAIFLIVCLSDSVVQTRVLHYANYLLKSLTFNSKSADETSDMAARALVYLIQTSKSYSAELLEKALDTCHEWLTDSQKDNKNDPRRLGAVYLARELALFTPTSFFLRASVFFRNIFPIVRDSQIQVRLAATQALRAALSVTSQREAKQKQEWYALCLHEGVRINNLAKDMKNKTNLHAALLVLNELLRISDAEFEKMRLEASGSMPEVSPITEPIDWLMGQRFCSLVESQTARQLVRENFKQIMACVSSVAPQDKDIRVLLHELYPRLCAFKLRSTEIIRNPDGTVSTEELEVKDEIRKEFWNSIRKDAKDLGSALTAQGLLVIKSPVSFASQADYVLGECKSTMQKQAKDSKKAIDNNVFVFIKLYVRAYGERSQRPAMDNIRAIFPLLFSLNLSNGLISVFHEITNEMPSLTHRALDGLIKLVYNKLTGQTLPETVDEEPAAAAAAEKPKVLPNYSPEESDVVLALETLGSFSFNRHSLTMCLRFVADDYLTSEYSSIRLAAVKCCVSIMKPFAQVYEFSYEEHKRWLLDLVSHVLRRLLTTAVTDQSVVVRQCVINCFIEVEDIRLLSHLAQPHSLEILFMALHDEKLEMQEAAVSLLTLLSELNPALILPRLRRVLLETLSQITNSGQARLEQHSARILVQMAVQNPKFIRPYMSALLTALMPKLRSDKTHVDVTIQVLRAVSELSIVGGAEVVKCIAPLFKMLTIFVQDSSSLQRREAALQCIGRVCRATAYVVDPYRDYPTLLDDLLRLLKTEMSSTMRRQAIKVLGILGAVDPYTHKVFTKTVQDSNTFSTALSLPMNKFDPTDPLADIIQWFNYERCTLEEYYPALTIANLMTMVQDEAYSQYYKEIATALMTIFRSLGENYPQYVHQVVPRLIEVTKSCKGRTHKEFFLIQLAGLVGIIKSNSKPYLKQIFRLIAEAWNEKEINKMTVVNVVEQIGVALGEDFAPYVCELIPYLLSIVQHDRDAERKITDKVLQCVKSVSPSLSAHLQLIIPPILSLIDEKGVPLPVRLRALDTILHLAKTEDISDYAPRLLQCFHKNLHYADLQPKLLDLLIEIMMQMEHQYLIFEQSVEASIRKHNLDRQYDHLLDIMRTTADKPSLKNRGNNMHNETFKEPRTQITIPMTPAVLQPTFAKQIVNSEAVERAWQVDGLLSKDDWSQWLIRLRSAFIRSGSSAAIRATGSVCEVHHHLAKELFNAAFMSVWTELPSGSQDEVTRKLTMAIKTSEHNEVIQAVLNLAEFMDHSVKGPLPISPEVLLGSAEKTKAYAKALRYTEIDIHKRGRREKGLTTHDCQQLITFANKLNVQEEAAGVVRYAEKHRIAMQGRWYEKLNEWEKALETHQKEKQSGNPRRPLDEITTHELRCLEALGKWQEMNNTAEELHQMLETKGGLKDPKIMVMSARGAWAVGNFEKMRNYVMELTENSQEGSFLRAVLAVRSREWSSASHFIDKVRDMYDSDLTSMASESYERAYGAMIQVQQLAELEEAMEYQMRPERRPRIALLWSRRLQGCRQNIEQWQRLIMLRSLVLNSAEIHPLRVKFASLCRQQGKMSMCRAVLRDLLNLPSQANLTDAQAPYDKPYLVMSLCKTLWVDEHRSVAIQTLDSLVSNLCRINRELVPEEGRMCAKACVRLGQWTEVYVSPAEQTQQEKSTLLSPNNRYGLISPAVPRLAHDQYGGGGSGGYEQTPVMPMALYVQGFQSQSLMDPKEQEITTKAIVCYLKATQFDPKWHKPWHKLATVHLKAMTRELELISLAKQREMERVQMQMSPIQPLIPLGAPNYSGQLSPVPGMQHGQTVFLSATNSYSPQMASQEPKPDMVHAIHAIHCFTMSLKLAPGSRLENTLRLLQLWFQYGEYDEVYKLIRENIKGLPVETWLEVIPQLMARLDSTDRMSGLIKQVIYELSKSKPQSIVYALTVASKSTNSMRRKNASEMVATMAGLHPNLVEEARLVSDELVRCAILWHEQWHDALDDASRLYFQEKNIPAMMEILKPLHQIIEKGPSTLKEQSFNQTYYADLADAYKFCQAFEKNKNTKELTQAWEIYCQIFKRIANQLRSLTSLDLNYISPLLMRAKDLELGVPGTYNPDPTVETVRIESFGTHLQVINSKQRPRKMTIRGSDGHEYQFLLKGHEDPRQDERVMQLFGLVNTLLTNNPETCRRNLTIQRYSITSLSHNSGLIGWIPNCDTLHAMIKDYREKKNISLSLEHKIMQQFAADTEQLTIMQKLQVFQKALASNPGDDLRQILWLKSPNSEVWFDRRTNYTRSVACMSMVGYILGLGDRHPSNLMLDRLTGKIVHIDFGDCFDVAMTREKFPERVPFRLTRMLINAMEVTGLEGTYRFTCEKVLKLLRDNKDGLLAVLEAFVYDPVINWRLLDGVKKDPKNRDKEDVRRMPAVQQEAAPRMMSEKVIDRIRQKLTGTEFHNQQDFSTNNQPVPVLQPLNIGATVAPQLGIDESHQIDRLIEQATIAENLCQAYIGWCPFW